MVLPESLLLIKLEVAEHPTVKHVVAVDYQVIARVYIAVFLQIRRAEVAVRFLKVSSQIIIGAIRRLHHRVVDLCARHAYPSHKVRIVVVQLPLNFEQLCCALILCIADLL